MHTRNPPDNRSSPGSTEAVQRQYRDSTDAITIPPLKTDLERGANEGKEKSEKRVSSRKNRGEKGDKWSNRKSLRE